MNSILSGLTAVFPSETLYALRRKWTDSKIVDSEMKSCIDVKSLHYRIGYNHGLLIAEAREKHGMDLTDQSYKAMGNPKEDFDYLPYYPTGMRDGISAYRTSFQ